MHDVSTGKASFPSWLQVFIDTPPFVFRLSLTPPGRALPCASGEHIWALCVVEAGAGGKTWRQKGLQRALKELAIQSRPLEECWSKLPNPNNVSNQQKPQHKSGLLTWRRTWLIWTVLTPWKKRVINVMATKKILSGGFTSSVIKVNEWIHALCKKWIWKCVIWRLSSELWRCSGCKTQLYYMIPIQTGLLYYLCGSKFPCLKKQLAKYGIKAFLQLGTSCVHEELWVWKFSDSSLRSVICWAPDQWIKTLRAVKLFLSPFSSLHPHSTAL